MENMFYDYEQKNFDISVCSELKSRSCRPGFRNLESFLGEVGIPYSDMKDTFKTNPQERELIESYLIVAAIIIIKVNLADDWIDAYSCRSELLLDFPQFVSESEFVVNDLLVFANMMKNVLRYVRASVSLYL